MLKKHIFYIIGLLFVFILFSFHSISIFFTKGISFIQISSLIVGVFFLLLSYFMPLYFIESIQENMYLDKNSKVYHKLNRTRYFSPFIFIYWHIQLKKI
ncbi:hypothetical protein SCHIN_v1c04740 [Spiroplasma chinense]|uniref:Uncharacterized protein n=1 Tax=Spiroplasma chinense TaxID=216932 RepID=A0A5B9Y3S3_9MOLU|nr:hypothetical protein SCHIN_v1c04740 [Spiroplasma chinense]